MLWRTIYFAIVVAVVVFAQWWFAVRFDEDELCRILVTAIGIGGVDATVARFRGKQ